MVSNTPRFLVLSSSLDSISKSRMLAQMAHDRLCSLGLVSRLIDLKDYPLPAFDNESVYADANFGTVYSAIAAAEAIIISTPIYNWAICATIKSAIEATGSTGENGRRSAWFDKIVTFLCAGGLPHSYMAYGAAAQSLMLDFKCVINPYAVYASGRDWSPAGRPSPPLQSRLDKTIDVQTELATLLHPRSYTSGWEI